MVVAVPGSSRIERDQEQVPALDPLQQPGRALSVSDRIAERAAELIQDRRPEQEVTQLAGLSSQHFAREVVDDVSFVTGEGIDEPAGVLATAQGECGQVEARRPAL